MIAGDWFSHRPFPRLDGIPTVLYDGNTKVFHDRAGFRLWGLNRMFSGEMKSGQGETESARRRAGLVEHLSAQNASVETRRFSKAQVAQLVNALFARP